MLAITGKTFKKEVEDYQLPVLVDFWAPHCNPCKQLIPIIEEIAEEYAGVIKVVSLNLDSDFKLAQRFGVSSIPTLLIFKDGQVVERLVGTRSKVDIENRLGKL